MDDFDEFKKCFLEEAKELLSSIEQCFLSLEKRPDDLENLHKIFRCAHNLKGSSGAVGFNDLTDFTHKLESLLVELKEGRIAVSGAIVDLLLRSNDYLLETIDLLQNDLRASYKNLQLYNELAAALDHRSVSEVSMEGVPTESVGTDLPLEAHTLGLIPRSSSPSTSEVKDENIRVSLLRINELINNAGELVIYQSVLQQQSLAPGVSIPPLMRATLAAMKKIIQGTRDLTMGLRMLPIKQTFQKMQRIVRDTSKALGKDVELHLSGEETEVDKTVLEQIADPLVHLIRNAIDHGLESTEARIAAGKSSIGHIFLSAYHRAGQVVIEIRDDGQGLDADKLIRIAKGKGLIAENAQLTPDQAHQLIFAPGFSTKAEVTDVSGRGVGMDVVKTNITQLQGQIEIETTLGAGACFRVMLPLTLAIVDGIVIRLGTERFIIPLAQVSEFFRPQISDINYIYDREEILTLRSETLPAFRLNRLLEIQQHQEHKVSETTALIVRDTSNGSFAVFVDEVIAQQQIVIKPLGNELNGRVGFMGSAILGDGKPSLILDLHEMTKKTRNKKKKSMEAA